MFERCDRPRVDNDQPRSGLLREYADRRASRSEVRKHLPRYFLGIGAYAFIGETVVGGHHDDCGREFSRVRGSPDGGNSAGEILQPGQAPPRLCLEVQTDLGFRGDFGIYRTDVFDGRFDFDGRALIVRSSEVATKHQAVERRVLHAMTDVVAGDRE